MRETRNRAKRIPQPGHPPRFVRHVAQRFKAVALPIDRVPDGNQCASFGEQEEEHAIDDRERRFKLRLRAGGASAGQASVRGTVIAEKRAQHVLGGLEHAVAQRVADACGVPVGGGDERVQRGRVGSIGRE